MGTLDEEVLTGEWGPLLAKAAGLHFWVSKAIKGVTDQEGLGGGKFFMEGWALAPDASG